MATDATTTRPLVPDETYAYPREDLRTRAAYGQPSAAHEILIVNGEPFPGRSTVLLLRQAIGY